MRESGLRLALGLGLAIASAATVNIGFLLQHRGLSELEPARAGMLALFRASLRSRRWLAGQLLGIVGFAAQVVAVAIAPLSLVQAFAAGGLALSVPLAALLFSHRVTRTEALAVAAIAIALATLPLGLPVIHERLDTTALWLSVAPLLALAGLAAYVRSGAARAVSAGLFYGVTDAAIKAISVRWGAHGADALVSPWLVLALAGTAAGFLAFQSALREGSAVTAVTLMGAFAALAATACGLISFSESFGDGPAIVTLHALAVAVVLALVRPLAAAQAGLAGLPGDDAPAPARSQPVSG